MPDRWVRMMEDDTQKIEFLETGIHPTRNREIQPICKITSKTTGDFVKLSYLDLIEMIGFYRKFNPPAPVTAILDIESMNIAKCKMTGKNEITCQIGRNDRG